MRKTRIGALAASTALASVTVFGGAAVATAQEADDPGTDTIVSEGNYSMTAKDLGNCQVEFTLDSHRVDDYGNWRGDFRVDEGDPLTTVEELDSSYGNRGVTYLPVITSSQGTADAVADREYPYDFDAHQTVVDLTKDRTVPNLEDAPNETEIRDGVEANENGEHTVNFGVYQGPVAQSTDAYNKKGEVTVTGCPTTATDLPELSSGSSDIFGLLTNLSS